jgi:hypothetical protein
MGSCLSVLRAGQSKCSSPGSPSKTTLPSSSLTGRSRIVTAIGGGGISPLTTAVMYSMPLIVAPAAAVGSGSCQTRVRLRELSGLEAANASADSAALPSGAVTTPSPLTGPGASASRRCAAVGGTPGSAGRR